MVNCGEGALEAGFVGKILFFEKKFILAFYGKKLILMRFRGSCEKLV